MAKDNRDNKPSKVRIFFGFAEIEAGNSTIEDGVRSIAAAVVRSVNPTPTPRFVKALPSALATGISDGDGKVEEPTLFDQSGEVKEQQNEAGDDLEVALDGHQPTGSKSERKEPRAPKKAPSYAFVNDLNLRPAGKTPLKDFFAVKKPSDQQEQLAVFLHYLKRTLDLAPINVNHLYTCFREVEKKVPKDINTVARNTATRKGWVDASDQKNLRITVQGENYVDHQLPATGSANS